MKSIGLKILFAALGILLFACKSIKNEGDTSTRQPTRDTLYLEKVCECPYNYKLKVKTSYFIVPDSINTWGWIALSQDLVYEKDEKIIRTVQLPFRTSLYQDSIPVLSTTLREARCILRGDSMIIKLYGIHQNDPPHEFFALTSPEGEFLWYYYGSMHEIYGQYGNEKIYKAYFGTEIDNLKHMTPVSP